MKLLDDNRNIMDEADGGRNEVCKVSIPLEEPLLFIDRLNNMNFNLVTDIVIRNYSVTFEGYDLMDYFAGKTEQEILQFISNEDFLTQMKQLSQEQICQSNEGKQQISLTEDNYNYFINNFGEYMVKISKELEKLYSFKVDFLNKAIVEIQNLGSKYLIADQMMQSANAE